MCVYTSVCVCVYVRESVCVFLMRGARKKCGRHTASASPISTSLGSAEYKSLVPESLEVGRKVCVILSRSARKV